MPAEEKLKHLEFIQSVISRMSANSFFLKGWGVTLVAALFVLATKDTSRKYVVVAFLPALTFWIVDAYFLSQERLFRALYNKVRAQRNEDINFSMDVTEFHGEENGWLRSLFTPTLLLFYLPMLIIMVVVTYLTR